MINNTKQILNFDWSSNNNWWTRFLFLRGLGFLYFIGFSVLTNQAIPLIGENGLLPAEIFLNNVGNNLGSEWAGFLKIPSVFWLFISDGFLLSLSLIGVGLSIIVMIGFANVPILFSLWILYMSFCHVGQLFYGYGWEFLLLEMGFLGIFLCPLWYGWGFQKNLAPSKLIIWALRWVCFRVMFGAGLIKIRGDACWDDWTCLLYHFETQPVPNPLSRFFHTLPDGILKFGVMVNHIVELIIPWFVFGPKKIRWIAGLFILGFQFMLILSGNLSYLNYLSMLACIACFDDEFFRILFSKVKILKNLQFENIEIFSISRRISHWILLVIIVILSYFPIVNMLSPDQAMNRSWDPLRLVNTYGAFGHIGKVRYEIEVEGSYDSVINSETKWFPYLFKCKPGNEFEPPCLMSPYHYRLDWQIWFAAMSTADREPWFIHFVYKLLNNDQKTLSLLKESPFVNGPPKFIKADRYVYKFYQHNSEKERWWTREKVGVFLPPLYIDHQGLAQYMKQFGWKTRKN